MLGSRFAPDTPSTRMARAVTYHQPGLSPTPPERREPPHHGGATTRLDSAPRRE